MSFTDVFIKKPVFATTINLILMLAGLIALGRLTIRQYPIISPSVITVTITYPGAPAQLMEGFITTPVENALTGIDGLDYIESQSSQGTTSITIYLKLGYDADAALTNISSKVSSVRYMLPKDINDPVIEKEDPDLQPIIYMSFNSNTMSAEAITDYLLRVIQPQFQTLDGVSSASIYGEREYAARVWLDPNLMASRNITATDVILALNTQNVQAASGNLKGPFQRFDIYSNTDVRQAEHFDHIVIRNDNGHLVRFGDIGVTQLGAQDVDSTAFVDGKNTVLIGVTPESTANPLAVANEVKALLPSMKNTLPEGLTSAVIKDDSRFIVASLVEVRDTIFEACILVFIVIYLMIGSFRAVLIPLVTIPLSLIGVCLFLFMLGYSINILTLLACVLAIGLVIDDAIVVLENIHRHLEQGKSPVDAALLGAQEISFAIIAMTCTLAAVYAPIGFMSGLTGRLFSEFAFTLAGSVIISGFIALTLSPMMCSKIYSQNEDINAGMAKYSNKAFAYIKVKYKALLSFILKNHKLWVVIGALLIYIACGLLFIYTSKELAPTEDQGYLLAIGETPETSNIDYTSRQTAVVGKDIYSQFPEIEHWGMINGYPNGVNSSISFIVFTDWSKRKRTAMQIANIMFPMMWDVAGAKMYVSSPAPLPGTAGFLPISFVLKTTQSYDYLFKWQEKFLARASKWRGLRNLDTDLKLDKPQVDVRIDRNKAGDLDISMEDIANALSVAFGQPIQTWFNLNGRSYQVIPQLIRRFRGIPNDIHNLNVRTHGGKLVPLSNVVTLSHETQPRELNHFQQIRSATITANLAPGVTQGDGLNYLNNLAKELLPRDIQVDYSDQLRQFVQTQGTMGQIFVFAILFIYLILAAQFESFRDPFIVMLSVPLSMFGALVTLRVFHGSLNIYTQIGLVTLIGLISKHGILIVEFANQLREQGTPLQEAIVESASIRLRPVLMTTAAMVLGSIPLALAKGAGAMSRQQTGLVIIGGMLFGTCLTLIVVPTAYVLLAAKDEKPSKKSRANASKLENPL